MRYNDQKKYNNESYNPQQKYYQDDRRNLDRKPYNEGGRGRGQ